MRRNTDFDFSRANNDKVSAEDFDLPYTEELVSSEGMHFHCWIPKGMPENYEKKLLSIFESSIRRDRDAVSFSWDYAPKGYSW